MRATLKDVAQRAGVSSATVSYVLNGKQSVSEKTKQRVLEAVRQLDYVPDLNARGLSTRDSKLIGVVVPQTEPGEHLMFQNTFYSEVLGSIEYYARQNGYHILISATDANESYQQMKESQIPIVLIDSYCNDYYYHNIRIDNAYGSYLATRYILQNGHREIAFLVGRLQENGVMKKRLTGYQKALAEFGVPYQPDYVLEGQIDYESGVQHARRTVSARWAARPRWTPWSGPPTAGPSSTAARGRPRCSAAPTCRGSCPTPPALTPPMRAAFGSARACPPMPHGTAAR